MADYPKFEDLVGRTMKAVTNIDNQVLRFETDADETFELYHSQDCCEQVTIEDIAGDLADLVGSPILVAAVVSQEDKNASESGTWTFYKIATAKGWVDVRWYGYSNGYYSEEVSFRKAA